MKPHDASGRYGTWRRLLNPFDMFVLSGATVNVVVVVWLVAYWLLYG